MCTHYSDLSIQKFLLSNSVVELWCCFAQHQIPALRSRVTAWLTVEQWPSQRWIRVLLLSRARQLTYILASASADSAYAQNAFSTCLGRTLAHVKSLQWDIYSIGSPFVTKRVRPCDLVSTYRNNGMIFKDSRKVFSISVASRISNASTKLLLNHIPETKINLLSFCFLLHFERHERNVRF